MATVQATTTSAAPPPGREAAVGSPADVRGKSVTIYDCRPRWHPNVAGWSGVLVAQLRYNPDSHLWTLYWDDRNSCWHRYDDLDPGTADQLLDETNDDSIFWG
jgi:Protein of unknown function (DUF3024)